MKRRRLALLPALLLWASVAAAHDVPDRVRVNVFVKPEHDRLLILVRMPANALIDFLFPTLPVGNWLDLTHARAVATEGANVWIADRLSLYENGAALPRPQLIAARLSRVNDPFFGSVQSALNHVTGAPLPDDTLVTQDEVTVDALLQTPIQSIDSRFSFEPRFARLGVVVDTTLTFLTPSGGIRPFQYQGDPETFALDPGRRDAFAHFVKAGAAHDVRDADMLLLTLCIGLIFRRVRGIGAFTIAFVTTGSLAILASLSVMPLLPVLRGMCGVLIAGLTVYLGVEAIIAAEGKRVGLALTAGAIAGGTFALGLQPILQFGGIHPAASALGFIVGVMWATLVALALCVAIVQIAVRLSRAPRAAIIIPAAIAIHVCWRELLDRADALTLVPTNAPAINPTTLVFIGAMAMAALAAFAYVRRSQPLSVPM
jgi:hypothetical protein